MQGNEEHPHARQTRMSYIVPPTPASAIQDIPSQGRASLQPDPNSEIFLNVSGRNKQNPTHQHRKHGIDKFSAACAKLAAARGVRSAAAVLESAPNNELKKFSRSACEPAKWKQ